MGNTSSRLLGTDSTLRAGRTPETLGRNDAADPGGHLVGSVIVRQNAILFESVKLARLGKGDLAVVRRCMSERIEWLP